MMTISFKSTRRTVTVACFLLFPVIAFSSDDAGKQRVTAPPFSARDLKNRLIVTDSLLARGPLIIDFWASWCGPCLEEFKALKKITAKYTDLNLTVLAVNEDGPSEITRVKQTAAKWRLPFIVVMDKGKAIMRKYNVTALPSLFLVDSDGTIHYYSRGYIAGDEAKLEKKLRELLPPPKKE